MKKEEFNQLKKLEEFNQLKKLEELRHKHKMKEIETEYDRKLKSEKAKFDFECQVQRIKAAEIRRSQERRMFNNLNKGGRECA